jgi:hypothetical protein
MMTLRRLWETQADGPTPRPRPKSEDYDIFRLERRERRTKKSEKERQERQEENQESMLAKEKTVEKSNEVDCSRVTGFGT